MASEDADRYLGAELSLFAEARVWGDYVAGELAPYLGGTVVEVGAGLGTRTAALAPAAERWIALEPDPEMARALARRVASGALPARVEVHACALATLPELGAVDTILYVDVLEHIAEDRAELAHAARRLRPGGHLVVLSPAHEWLYSAFDRAVGHHRRYTLASLAALTPEGLGIVRRRMLDCVGLAASSVNRFVLRSAMPTRRQIALWDRVMVRASRWLDPLLGHRFGKSVLVVWQKARGTA